MIQMARQMESQRSLCPGEFWSLCTHYCAQSFRLLLESMKIKRLKNEKKKNILHEFGTAITNDLIWYTWWSLQHYVLVSLTCEKAIFKHCWWTNFEPFTKALQAGAWLREIHTTLLKGLQGTGEKPLKIILLNNVNACGLLYMQHTWIDIDIRGYRATGAVLEPEQSCPKSS